MATTKNGIYYQDDYTKVADVPEDLKKLAESVDTAIDNVQKDAQEINDTLGETISKVQQNQENIEELQEDNETNKDDIASLQKELEEQKAENERLRQDMNAYPSNTASGEYITLTDSADSRFNKFKILGKSEQATRSGKNRLKVEDGTITLNGVTVTAKDGEITVNGTATADLWVTFAPKFKSGTVTDTSGTPLFEVTDAAKYTMSVNEISGSYSVPNESNKYFSIVALKNSNQFNVSIGSGKRSTTVDLSSTDQVFGVWIMISEGVVLNNYKFNAQLEPGETVTDYEQYGAMPSPDYKSDIQNITDNIDIISCNENLALDGYSTPKTDTDFYSGVSSNFTPLEDGWGRFVGNNTNGGSNLYTNAFISFKKFKNIIKPNTAYRLLAEFRNVNMSGNTGGDYMCLVTGGGTEPFRNYQLYKSSLSQNSKFSVKLNPYLYETTLQHLFRSFLSVSPGNSTSLEVKISLLEENSTETEVKVENQEFVFPLAEGQKLYEGSYLADDGIHHKRKQIEIDISQFATGMPYKGTFNVSNNKIRWDYTSVKGICNYFNNAESEQVTENFSASQYINDNEFNFRMGNTKDRIYFKNSAFTTLEQWRDFFNNNEVIVEYECNEYVEAYTDEQKQVYDELVKTAKSYKTVTNIFSTNEVSPVFEVNYRKDIETMINNVNKAVLNNA